MTMTKWIECDDGEWQMEETPDGFDLGWVHPAPGGGWFAGTVIRGPILDEWTGQPKVFPSRNAAQDAAEFFFD